jgi:hypothetical protein
MKLRLSVTRDFSSQCEEKEKNEILEKQKHRCKACSISIKKYAKFEKTKEGYVGLCSVCHASQHLETLPQKSAGKIIMLPEISQVDLIALSRMIMLIKRLPSEEHSEDMDSAGLIHMLLNEAGQHAESFYASGASDVELVAQMLSNQTDEAYEQREKGLYNMKWLPDYDYFKKEMDYWFKVLMENEKSTYHPTKWENLHNMYLKNNKG